MNAAWRLEKSELKIAYFDGRTHNDALAQRSHVPYIPENMWKNLVEFWESEKGQKKDGKEPDPLAVWLDTHQPKKGSRLDEASAATKKLIEDDLACHTLDSCNDEERMKIFKKHVGEDKNGYAKTFGLGVKVPRSRAKRCALEEERSKRIKSEKKVEKMEMKLKKVTTLMKKFLILQGMSDDLCLSDDDEEEEGASYEKTGEENLEKENLGNESEEDVSCRLEPQDDYLEDEQMV
ncbi:Cytochrome P450 monooxygenase BOA7 [Bienertia sinuspersici]